VGALARLLLKGADMHGCHARRRPLAAPIFSLVALSAMFTFGCSNGGGNAATADSGAGPRPGVDAGTPTDDGGSTPRTTGGACHTDVGLSPADSLVNLVAEVRGDKVKILFDPYDKAVDYRVYALPKAGDVSGDTIKGKSEFERNGEKQSRDWEAKREKK